MEVEALFLQFRSTREPAPLGALFDLVADDLFGVALHLCRDQEEAEDLVQATFLVAIERAERYDAARPLRPWLLGILHQEAKARRRSARRAPDPERLPVAVEPPPVQIVLAAEAADAVAAAIRQVPQPYRDVLDLRLVQSLPNGEIAARLHRSPGAVRTQLWRGLELLRALLPKGLALTLAAQLCRPGLAAVRQRVLAAGTRIEFAGASVLAGAWLMSKAWIGAAAVAVLATGWWAWPREAADAVSATSANSPPAALAAATPSPERVPQAQPLAERTLVAAPVVGQPDAAAAMAPMQVRVVVVDGSGDPVADADVALFEPLPRVKRDADVVQPARGRVAAPPFWNARTDVAGRAEFTIDRECFVAAKKDGVGSTGDLRLEPGRPDLREPRRLVLRPVCRVHGVVLLPDGAPAAAATVSCWHTTGRYWSDHLASELPPTITDAAGSFEFGVLPELDCRLRARLGERYTILETVDTGQGGPDYEVTLRFPGAWSVRGVLLGSAGKPVAGEVRLVSNPLRPGHEPRYARAKADGEGRFELLLTEGGSFELVGGIEGQTAVHVPVVLDDARPHQEFTLRLLPFVVLAGRAVDERGEPRGGVFLGVSPVGERTSLHQCLSDLQGIYARGSTAADGTFRFLVPAGPPYRLVYRASPSLFVEGPEVSAPTEDALLVVRAADQQGFTVTGRVVVAATGVAVPSFRVDLITHHGQGGGSMGHVADGVDGTFTAGPLPVGERYTMRITAEGLADGEAGPFDSTVRTEDVVVRLDACGSVACRVLRSDGTPAAKAMVALTRDPEGPFDRIHQGETDNDGRIRLDGVTPGRHRASARATVAGTGAGLEALTVLPGQEANVVLTLQR